MKKDAYYRLNKEPDIINGFSRTLTEIQWLLLVLVLFYLVVGEVTSGTTNPVLILAACLYSAFVIFFRYLNFFKEAKAWKIAFQTWVMIIFISGIIYYTGKLHSPLFNLYLLPIIASALTLGKIITLLEVGLIFTIFLYLKYSAYGTINDLLSLADTSHLFIQFFPMILVAYISTMLAADIQLGFSKLKIISEIDDLTKLFNYRTFKSLSEKMIHHAQRQEQQASVLMIDADNLKKVNDRFGHEAGNLLLTHIAQCLTMVLRGGDIAARYGGDEFVILLPKCTSNDALQVADRIITEFKATHIRYQGESIELSASIGVACFPDQGHSIDILLSKADKAMYVGKRRGNNLVTLYSADMTS